MDLPVVNDENYPDFLAAHSAVVTFGMIACVACEAFDPVFRAVAERYRGVVLFGKAKMHVPGACREIKKRFTFDTFPTTHFYKKGALVHTEIGRIDEADLIQRIEAHGLFPVFSNDLSKPPA